MTSSLSFPALGHRDSHNLWINFRGAEHSLPDIPSPPTGVLPGDATLEDLVLTPDLAEAGKRVVIWAAASAAAKELQRSGDHQIQFWLWTGQLLKWHHQIVYPDSVIVDAIHSYYNSSKCFTPCNQTAQATLGGERKPENPVAQNSIRRISDEHYQIVLASEVMEITGEKARHFVDICRWKRIDATSLILNKTASTSARSVATQQVVGEWQTEKLLREFSKLSPAERRKRQAEIASARQDLEAELAITDSLERREEIETALDFLRKHTNDMSRLPRSKAATHRNSVNQSLRRLAEEQSRLGRTALVQLIDSCRSRGRHTNDFVYTGPDWEFLGF